MYIVRGEFWGTFLVSMNQKHRIDWIILLVWIDNLGWSGYVPSILFLGGENSCAGSDWRALESDRNVAIDWRCYDRHIIA